MPADVYGSFEALSRRERRGVDFRLWIRDRGSACSVVAPHGGRIEPGTSALARAIAGGRYNCYCFEGLKYRGNRRLHITSHRFDEPRALELLARSRWVVVIHGCTDARPLVYTGGLDRELKTAVDGALRAGGVPVAAAPDGLRGLNPRNICNRGATRRGFQLEVSRGLRDDAARCALLCDAVRSVLENLSAEEGTE